MKIFSLILFMLLVILASVSGTSGIACENDHCSKCYITLVTSLMNDSDNVFNLSRAFLPPNTTSPVFVRVNYHYPGGANDTWFWSKETSALIHPIEGFQYFSLFFGNSVFQTGNVDLTLPDECANASKEAMELLTQRVRKFM